MKFELPKGQYRIEYAIGGTGKSGSRECTPEENEQLDRYFAERRKEREEYEQSFEYAWERFCVAFAEMISAFKKLFVRNQD